MTAACMLYLRVFEVPRLEAVNAERICPLSDGRRARVGWEFRVHQGERERAVNET